MLTQLKPYLFASKGLLINMNSTKQKDGDWLDEIVDSDEENDEDDIDDLCESSAKCLKINL